MSAQSENACGTARGVEFRVCLGGMPIDEESILKYTLAESVMKTWKQTCEKMRNENQKPQNKHHEIEYDYHEIQKNHHEMQKNHHEGRNNLPDTKQTMHHITQKH